MKGEIDLPNLPAYRDESTIYPSEVPDDALTEIAEHCPELNDQQRRYVYWRILGTTPTIAFKNAGYTGSSWRTIETRPKIREAIAKMIEITEPEHRITQKSIVGILMEAIDVARQKGQAGNMIEGAKVLSDTLGITAAQKINIQQNSMIEHKHEVKVIQQLEKEQLERLLDIQRVLAAPTVIEGEYVEVDR
jgi:phage terminase small subunit